MTSRSVRFLLACLVALTLSFTCTSAFGQGSKMKSEYDQIEEKDRDRPDLRTKWMMRGREAPKGQSAAALRLRAHHQKMAMRALREAASAKAGAAGPNAPAVTSWVPLGPAPIASWSGQSYGSVTGRITSVAMDPTDATGNTVYVGGAFGGLWKSTNAATANPANVAWTPLTDQQAALAVGAVSIKPDGSVLLVGTGEPNNALGNYYGLGFLQSTDGGANWNLISTANGGSMPLSGMGVAKMAWGAGGLANTVVAGMDFTPEGIDEGIFTLAAVPGFYTSTDGTGSTWTYHAPPGVVTPNDGVTDVVFNAKANNGAGAFFGAVSFRGIYTSTNGTTWTRLSSQPGTITANCPINADTFNCPMIRGQLAVVPGRNEMYFWFVDINDTDQGIWRSTNGGTSWMSISELGIANCGDTFGCGTSQAFYNLEIAAVPEGPNATDPTDLYAGAVNLFKCKLANGGTSTACSTLDSNQANKWINLTHVYGCSPIANIAHVHPDEHGLDFRVINGKAVMYFGNDGGMYRALDGFTGLKSGTCTSPNTSAGIGFENLNTGTMGSLTQFVSFSVHPTDQNTLLGGTQDNGSPATTTATSSSTWQTAGRGDGGYNEINPTNPAQWFASHTFVDVEVCNIAPGCAPPDFENNLVVEGGDSKINGDDGAFYTPYILDPQNSGELLLGTCRVWRGSTAGAGFTALSNTFDGSVTCPGQGGQIDLVRGLAAGGPTSGGFSNVVYATTEGTGPFGASNGEVWSTTNAAGGPGLFLDRTFNGPSGSINPNNYTISSVAIDKSDATGQTAFVGIMGFVDTGTHIWKTTSAGQNWTPFGDTTTGLPDAPVNALLVDSGTVYAGTDVGVFQCPTSGANWTEVGPNAQPGATGYLPNVAVTAIRLFNSGGVKKLRVSTYGRGIWEFALAVAPDYQVAVSNNPLTAFPSQTATFTGTLTAVNGYSNPVTLSCGAGAPGACTFLAGNPITPTNGGAAFSVSMNSGVATADYNFNIHTVGSDANNITHDTAVTLHVVDFGLTAPGAVNVQQGASGTAQFQVTASGAFAQPVTLSCSNGLPANATCSFAPNPAMPTSGNPASVTLTVTASANTPTGTTTVTIQGTTTNPAATRTTTFQLTVKAPPDFTWTGSGSHTVLAGQTTANYSFTATPTNGDPTFAADVTFGCSGLPDSTAACVFNTGQADPTKIAAGTPAAQGQVTMTITTKGPNNGQGTSKSQRADQRSPWLPLTLPIAGIVMVGIVGRKVSRHSAIACLCVSLMLLGLLVACGGGSSGPPPPPPQISVSVSPSTTVNLWPTVAGWPTQTQKFTATVNNSTNQNVTWAVTGGSTNGTIDTTGLYTAPGLPVPPATVTVTATAAADPTKSGSGKVNIQTPTTLGTDPNIVVTATEGSTSHASSDGPSTLIVN